MQGQAALRLPGRRACGKFIAIGLNYADHAAESGVPIPKEPVVFMKATSCIQGPNDPVMLPKGSVKTDWEVELGVVIGTHGALRVAEEGARLRGRLLRHQRRERARIPARARRQQWDKGKGCDTFGPIGPWLVTRDEIENVQKLDMWLDVNGERMQTGNTKTMIFDVAKLVSYVSQFMTLMPGDVITTGTPPGVGLGMKPTPQYLKNGDVVRSASRAWASSGRRSSRSRADAGPNSAEGRAQARLFVLRNRRCVDAAGSVSWPAIESRRGRS